MRIEVTITMIVDANPEHFGNVSEDEIILTSQKQFNDDPILALDICEPDSMVIKVVKAPDK